MSTEVLDRLRSNADAYRRELLAGVRILVIDDEPAICDLLEAAMLQDGFTVDTVHSGEEAWALIEKEPYDLLVVDKNLPGMTGVDLIAKVKDAQITCDSVMVTGFASIETISAALEAGASDYIAKPFDEIGLVMARFRRILDARIGDLVYGFVARMLKAALKKQVLDNETRSQLGNIMLEIQRQTNERVPVMSVWPKGQRDLDLASLRTAEFNLMTVPWQAAVEQTRTLRPLVVLVNVLAGGRDLIQSIKRIDPQTDVVGYTLESVELDLVLAAIEAGASDFVIVSEEGVDLLRYRAQHGLGRVRRRLKYLGMISALSRIASEHEIEGWDDMLLALPADDRAWVEATLAANPAAAGRGDGAPDTAAPVDLDEAAVHVLLDEIIDESLDGDAQ